MGFKEDLMKQYRQWKEDPTPFLKGEVVIFKIIEENERLKLMFDIKHTGSEANMMDARKKIEELKSQLEFAIGYIESYGLLTLFLKEKEMEGPK